MEEHGGFLIQPVAKIGNGSFGYVERIELFTASKSKCNGEYARKVFSPSIEVDIEVFKLRFRREVLYQDMCRHEDIAAIYICNLQAENPWFIMELAVCDLYSEIQSGSLDFHEKVKVILMVLRGVSHMHKKECLHRDIKPTNILKYSDGTYKVSDFGLIKNTKPDGDSVLLTKIGNGWMGSTRYMAPEIFMSEEYSIRTDIYALGKLIDDFSFEDKTFEKIMNKCISMNKEDRYATVDEIISEIEQIDWSTHQ